MTRAGQVSLARMLHRGHQRAAVWTVLVVGLVAGLCSFLMLHERVERHLSLVARSLAYNIEAAVAFRDEGAVREIIDTVARHEGLASVTVRWPDGALLAQVRTIEPGSARDWLRQAVAPWAPLQAQAAVSRNDLALSDLSVEGDGTEFATLLAVYVVGALVAMALAAAIVVPISHQVERQILDPLEALRRFTHAVRVDRAFSRRAPAVAVEEIDALGADFNALLEEVQSHEAELLSHQAHLKLRNETLSHEASHDTLTGLFNRAYFERRLESAIEQARGALGLAVLFIDADGLKLVNDRQGHAAGDQLLCDIAQRLRMALREGDCVARLGGDEFAVLVDPLTRAGHAELLMQKIEQAMRAPATNAQGSGIAPSVSIGCAVYPAHGQDAMTLLLHADQQMYVAKRQRRAASASLPQLSPGRT